MFYILVDFIMNSKNLYDQMVVPQLCCTHHYSDVRIRAFRTTSS